MHSHRGYSCMSSLVALGSFKFQVSSFNFFRLFSFENTTKNKKVFVFVFVFVYFSYLCTRNQRFGKWESGEKPELFLQL